MANENQEVWAKLEGNLDRQVPIRININVTKIFSNLVQRLSVEILPLLLSVVIDGKVTETEKQMIVDRVVQIVKDVLKDL